MSEHVTMAEHWVSEYGVSRMGNIHLTPRRGMNDVRSIICGRLSTEVHFTDGSIFRMNYGFIGEPKNGDGVSETITPKGQRERLNIGR